MDEILIEEKRYISSKRAAKITGYAKDYIGQLCREGRVPARLVGRSWYVLETAIQDHRFGNQEIIPKEPLESPKYEASPVEILPPVSRADEGDEEDEEVATTSTEDSGGSEDNSISDSWREWFDRVSNTTETQTVTVQATDPVTTAVTEEPEPEPETEPVEVPIHTIYRQPPQELLPHSIEEEERREEPEQAEIQQKVQKGGRVVIRTIQVCGIALAMVTVTLAVAGSGYLDKYIISVGQVRIIAGVTLYNK